MFDAVSDEQLLAFSNLLPNATPTTFTLGFTFNGISSTTAPITLSGGIGSTADVRTIQDDLNNLLSVKAAGGFVSVIQTGTGLYTVIFGGGLTNTTQTLVPTLINSTSTFGFIGPPTVNVTNYLPSTMTPQSVMFSGAITIDPNDPAVLYLGTGESNTTFTPPTPITVPACTYRRLRCDVGARA